MRKRGQSPFVQSRAPAEGWSRAVPANGDCPLFGPLLRTRGHRRGQRHITDPRLRTKDFGLRFGVFPWPAFRPAQPDLVGRIGVELYCAGLLLLNGTGMQHMRRTELSVSAQPLVTHNAATASRSAASSWPILRAPASLGSAGPWLKDYPDRGGPICLDHETRFLR